MDKQTPEGIVSSEQVLSQAIRWIRRLLLKLFVLINIPSIKKIVRSTTKILAHDEQNVCRVGDLVQVVEVRPLSRRKRWKVRQVVSKTESVNA